MEVESPWWVELTAKSFAFWVGQGMTFGEQSAKKVEDSEKRVREHFTVKPRMTARGEEVVRLRDVENLEWKEIVKRIRGYPDWAKGQKGEPVSKRALMAAYWRQKNPTKK